jgi:hypothetical protein
MSCLTLSRVSPLCGQVRILPHPHSVPEIAEEQHGKEGKQYRDTHRHSRRYQQSQAVISPLPLAV